VELYLHSPNTPSSQLKHRDNFTVTLSLRYIIRAIIGEWDGRDMEKNTYKNFNYETSKVGVTWET
jgi:hypothetical protein